MHTTGKGTSTAHKNLSPVHVDECTTCTQPPSACTSQVPIGIILRPAQIKPSDAVGFVRNEMPLSHIQLWWIAGKNAAQKRPVCHAGPPLANRYPSTPSRRWPPSVFHLQTVCDSRGSVLAGTCSTCSNIQDTKSSMTGVGGVHRVPISISIPE